jgi:hypothetical protein
VESSEEALNPDCPIFAATEKRYYPYSPGVPVDPIATSLFLCQFQQPSLTLALYSDHKHLYQLLVEITCHMRRAKAKHNLFSSFLFFSFLFFSFLFFSFEKLEGMEHLILMRTFWGLWSAI